MRLVFYRDYHAFFGGHLKVWDYFNHALAAGWDARIYLTPHSRMDAGNPWAGCTDRRAVDWPPQDADALFIGGMDWQAMPEGIESRLPVINIIQHVRHADASQPLRRFLSRRAIRIAVSAEVGQAILATGEVNGPVHVIDAALSLPGEVAAAPGVDVFVGALKAPAEGRATADRLRACGHDVDLCDEATPRADYLARIAAARVAVFWPNPTEGFYLPALEAMALGRAVVVPDCVGNRTYLAPGVNASVPERDPAAMAAAAAALLADAEACGRMAAAGPATAARFGQAREREAFSALLGQLGGGQP